MQFGFDVSDKAFFVEPGFAMWAPEHKEVGVVVSVAFAVFTDFL